MLFLETNKYYLLNIRIRPMTNYKFRGKSISTREWVFGHYVRCAKEVTTGKPIMEDRIYTIGGSYFVVDPTTVGLYSGKEDNSGKEAYIGDICKSFFGDSISVIEWHKTNPWIVLRYIDSRNGMYSFDHLTLEAFEIIGNLHENPTLLTTQ